jgi:hypothetical protein
MSSSALTIDIIILVLAIAAFAANLISYRNSKRLVGDVKAKWALRFNLAFPWEWLRIILLLGILAIAVLVAIERPPDVDSFGSLALAFLVLAFFPRNNCVVVGSAGLLDRRVFIPWTSVKEKRLVEERGRRYLELKIAAEPGTGAAEHLRRIRVPGNVSLVLD